MHQDLVFDTHCRRPSHPRSKSTKSAWIVVISSHTNESPAGSRVNSQFRVEVAPDLTGGDFDLIARSDEAIPDCPTTSVTGPTKSHRLWIRRNCFPRSNRVAIEGQCSGALIIGRLSQYRLQGEEEEEPDEEDRGQRKQMPRCRDAAPKLLRRLLRSSHDTQTSHASDSGALQDY